MKARLFLDTNVMLDLLGKREPFFDSIAKVATLADKGELDLIASSLSYSTVNYLLTRFENSKVAIEKLRKFKVISEVSTVDESVVEKGLNSNFSDFEDSLQYYSALKAKCNIIITRNAKDFKEADLPIMSAEEYLISIGKK